MTRCVRSIVPVLLALSLFLAITACQEDPTGPATAPGKAALLLADGGGGTPPAWISGRVRDDMGRSLGGIDVVALPGLQRATTHADGTYTLGPLPAGSEIFLQTESPDTVSAAGRRDAWFDFYTDPFDPATTPTRDLLLLVRYDDIDFEFGDDTFVRYLHHGLGLSSKYDQVFTWRFPVRVYSRPDTFTATDDAGNTHTTDLRAIVAETVDLWNTRLGFTAMVESADSNSAEIIASLEGIGLSSYGRTLLFPRLAFWRYPPERVRVQLNTDITRRFLPEHRVEMMSTLMHEFGHALGHHNHVIVKLLDAKGRRINDILMYTSAPDHTYQPHPFDLRVIRAFKRLDSGVNMRQYENFNPSADFPPLGD